jgi:hypothetical protein
VFCVDYATLYRIIRQYLFTGIFRAKVDVSRHNTEEGYIELEVKNGAIVNCYFITMQGQVYQWEQWEEQLARYGVLNWEQTSQPFIDPITTNPNEATRIDHQESAQPVQPTPPVPPTPPAQSTLPPLLATPYRISVISASQQRGWPMLHRQVYSLIDGRRQLPEIAQMLRRTQQEIARVISDLRQYGFIQI